LLFILKNLRQKINTTSQIFGENPRCGAGVAQVWLGELARRMAA
jgi:hypothetical protein